MLTSLEHMYTASRFGRFSRNASLIFIHICKLWFFRNYKLYQLSTTFYEIHCKLWTNLTATDITLKWTLHTILAKNGLVIMLGYQNTVESIASDICFFFFFLMYVPLPDRVPTGKITEKSLNMILHPFTSIRWCFLMQNKNKICLIDFLLF